MSAGNYYMKSQPNGSAGLGSWNTYDWSAGANSGGIAANYQLIDWNTFAAKSNITIATGGTLLVDFAISLDSSWVSRGYNLSGRVYAFTAECNTGDANDVESVNQSGQTTFQLEERAGISHLCGQVQISNVAITRGDYVAIVIEFTNVTAVTACSFNWACTLGV
jgi:translation initiation factor IF-1